MSKPREAIEQDLKRALKQRDSERVSTLRLLLADLTNERIRAGEEVDAEGLARLVRKAIKQRKDSADQYRAGNRPELADKEEREIDVLATYLPEEVDEDEIRQAVTEFVQSSGVAGASGIGPVMKAMMAKFSGRADGSVINRIAREVLSQEPS